MFLLTIHNEGNLERTLIDQGTVRVEVVENFPADVDLNHLKMTDPSTSPNYRIIVIFLVLMG